MSRQVKVWYTCKTCEHEQEVKVYPVIPAQTYGPPESCSPEEGGEIEPEQCEKCETPIDAADCHEKTADDERPDPDEDRAIWRENE